MQAPPAPPAERARRAMSLIEEAGFAIREMGGALAERADPADLQAFRAAGFGFFAADPGYALAPLAARREMAGPSATSEVLIGPGRRLLLAGDRIAVRFAPDVDKGLALHLLAEYRCRPRTPPAIRHKYLYRGE